MNGSFFKVLTRGRAHVVCRAQSEVARHGSLPCASGIAGFAIGTLLLVAASNTFSQTVPEPTPRRPSGSLGSEGTGSASPSYIVSYEQGHLIRAGQVVEALGPDLMGDGVNEYTSALEFTHTDVSLPGNSDLAVMVGRKLVTASKQPTLAVGHFGDWELDIPHLQTVAGGGSGMRPAPFWYGRDSAGTYDQRRCSHFASPPAISGATAGAWTPVNAESWWDGYHLVAPGWGVQTLLKRVASISPVIQPSDGGPYPVLTKAHWQLSCLDSLANSSGEGFLAHAPDGSTYRFDHLARRSYPTYQSISEGVQVNAGRTEIWILPSRVVDRFGNVVTYRYDPVDPWQLLSIDASDGRSISFAYVPGTHRIHTVFDGTRTWTYGYTGDGRLQSVTLPDGSAWRFDLQPLEHAAQPGVNDPGCGNGSFDQIDKAVYTGTPVHPSGATGAFTHRMRWHATSNVPGSIDGCSGHNYYIGGIPHHNTVPIYASSYTLTAKTLSGPGMDAMTWTYDYSDPVGNFAPPSGSVVSKTVTITDPLGHITRNTYGTEYGLTEGLLLASSEGIDGNGALRTTTYAYAAPSDGPYPRWVGEFNSSGEAMSKVHTPQRRRVITQQGVDFGLSVEDGGFDIYARPTNVFASSTLGYERAVSTAYFDDTRRWVLGQLASRTVAGTEASSTRFDDRSLPVERYQFGQRQASYTYDGGGLLESVTDGRGLVTRFGDYKRGLAQQIFYPDGRRLGAAVNNLGTIESYTNEANATWGFTYDAMGRIASVTPPQGDAVPYDAKTYSFVQVHTPEMGLAPGHWRQVIAEGNAITLNFFDARWRKRVTMTYDAANMGDTQRMQSFSYDPYNRTTFAAYPTRSIESVDSPVPGAATVYDALGRPTATRADSELGPLTTQTQYIEGFQKRVVNPRKQVTVTRYQAFDEPSMDAITEIMAPEGLRVSIPRDVFGKSLSVSRSGGYAGAYVSATRHYVYDEHQRLCKTVEPEIGATIQDYDAANNVAWRASGLSLTSTHGCNRGDVR